MKAVTLDGYVRYKTTRLFQGRQFIFVIHFSPEECREGRAYVASRLRRWRASIKPALEREVAWIH